MIINVILILNFIINKGVRISIMEEKKIEELKNKIEKWQEELDTVWAGKDTDAAEVERRNLMNLINNAKNEINEIENGPAPKESIEDLEKKFEDIKSGKSEKTVKINRLKMHIEKL